MTSASCNRVPVVGRFAPSPSGHLHLGHAQTLLLGWLQTRALGGRFLLRIEDVDRARSQAAAYESIPADLRWLGFDWDEGPGIGGPAGTYLQSERTGHYEAALHRLKGRIFACTCSRRDLRGPPGGQRVYGELRYPGNCREAPSHGDGRPSSLRLRVEPEWFSWQDGGLGPQRQDPSAQCGDFILRARNGDFAYQLAVVVDDIAMGVTHVLRGRDLLDSTSRQLLLYRLLGAPAPRFAHVPLRLDGEGQRLSKSRRSPAIKELREDGADPRTLLGQLAEDVGLLDQARPCRPAELLPSFVQRCSELLSADPEPVQRARLQGL